MKIKLRSFLFLGALLLALQSFAQVENNSLPIRGSRSALVLGADSKKPNANTVGELTPNPASEKVELAYNISTSMTLRISNVLGLTVSRKDLSKESKAVSIDVSDLPEGVYFCSLLGANNKAIATKRLIVRR